LKDKQKKAAGTRTGQIAKALKVAWNRRAKERNPEYYIEIVTSTSRDAFEAEARRVVDKELLVGLQDQDLSSMSILDIGCGVGRFERALADKFATVYGVDISDDMIAAARRRLKDKSNVLLFSNDGTELPFVKDGSLDMVFSYSVYQHLPPSLVWAYSREAFRALRHGGFYRFEFMERSQTLKYSLFHPSLRGLVRVLLSVYRSNERVISLPLAPHGRLLAWSEVKAKLEEIGFEGPRIFSAPVSEGHMWVVCRKP
jgi:SAM-dependent methyltransferase